MHLIYFINYFHWKQCDLIQLTVVNTGICGCFWHVKNFHASSYSMAVENTSKFLEGKNTSLSIVSALSCSSTSLWREVCLTVTPTKMLISQTVDPLLVVSCCHIVIVSCSSQLHVQNIYLHAFHNCPLKTGHQSQTSNQLIQTSVSIYIAYAVMDKGPLGASKSRCVHGAPVGSRS